MEPGRELDMVIGTKVMGWKRPASNMPPYSTDIAAAWQVVERMATYGDFSIHASRNFSAERNGWNVVMGGDYFTNAPTAPHAICLAALKAIGRDGSDPL